MDHTNVIQRKEKVSVIIPAFNEERRLPATLGKIHRYFENKDYSYEVLVVDDGSTDNTAERIEDYIKMHNSTRLIRNGINKGKGYSVKNGFLQANGDYLLFSDADLSTPIEEIDKFSGYLREGYDVAIGSRGLKESDIQVHQPWFREMMGKAFNILVRLLSLRGFKDTQCGFKCFTRKAALEICKRQRMERFSFDVEMLYIAKKLGYKVKEVPVRWVNEPETKVKAVRDSVNMFFDLLRIRLNDMTRKYE